MSNDPMSLMVGMLAGAAYAWGLNGTAGVRRARRGLVVGLSALVVLTSWAVWRDTFPATFGPFVVITLLISFSRRDWGGSRT